MRNTSQTDGDRIDAMADDDIDILDILHLTEKSLFKAKLRMPQTHNRLVAAARQAKREIAEGKSVPMDYDRL